MKKLFKTLSLFLIVILLTGCVKLSITIDVSSDGSTSATMKYLFSDAYFQNMGGDKDTVIKQLKEQFSDETGVTVEEVQEKIDDTDYYGILVKGFDTKDLLTITNENNTLKLVMKTNELNSMTQQQGEVDADTASQYKQMGIEMNLIFNMPSTPETNVGTVEGKSVKIDLLSDLIKDGKQVSEIVITCKQGQDYTPYIIGGIAIVAIIAIVIILKRKKNKNQTVE